MSESKFWLDIAVAEIVKKYPKGEITVSSGISPSGAYHIGNFREIVTTDAVARGLKKAGRKVRHVHFVDDSDPLRRLYPFLPKEFEQYVGWPYWMIPDPKGGCHASYAEHYFAEFKQTMDEIDIEMDIRISHEEYQKGSLDKQLDQAIEKAAAVRKILKEASGRDLPGDWTGVQVLNDDKTYRNIKEEEWKDIRPLTKDGKVKLVWRLDWPARWAMLGVDVEPFGREHATKGGSYDTGVPLVKEVFGAKPPYPVPYDTINLIGETKKMSSSLGNLVSLADGLEIMPPEVLRYFIVRSRPDRKIFFDPGVGLYNLIDEFSLAETNPDNSFKEAYQFATDGIKNKTISSVPFKHLVSVYQTAQEDAAKATTILERTGYEAEAATLEREFKFVKNWLDKYAPEEVKFSVQEELPSVELSKEQKDFLTKLAGVFESVKELQAQAVHDTIYELSGELKLPPGEAFQAIYRVILGKDSGPKAGWFLASLDKDWLVKRLHLES